LHFPVHFLSHSLTLLAMAIEWQTATSLWLEDEASGHFELAAGTAMSHVRFGWQPPQSPGRVAEVAQWLGASLPTGCDCAPVFPPGFAFCPHCGHALRQTLSPSELADAAIWIGPFSDQHLPEQLPKGVGYCATPLALAVPLPSNRPQVSLPAPPAPGLFLSGNFGFAAQRLLVLAYQQNVLQYWDPNANNWQLLVASGVEPGQEQPIAPDLGFTVSEYYCLPPISTEPGAVALIPTAQGVMQLHINPVQPAYQLQTVLAETLVSAPGRVFHHLACLYQHPEHQDQVYLWTRVLAPGAVGGMGDVGDVGDMGDMVNIANITNITDPAGELRYACPMPPMPELLAGWSRPVAFQGKLIWLHTQGHLLWQPGSAPKWLPWPPAWQPRLAYAGPMQSRDGRLWLLGQQQQTCRFLELGAEEPEQEPSDGARLGFGRFIFRLGHALQGEPWGSFTIDNENDHHALVWPLLAYHHHDPRLRGGLVLRLPDYTGTADQLLLNRNSHDCKLEWQGEQSVELDRLQLARPWEIRCFVHQHHLWVHHPDWNTLRGWRLQEPL
jgi:hypothetical protein